MTTFKGRQTGFNPSGSNECVPNPMGPPATKFSGRGAVPEGPLKHYPGGAADTGNTNRRGAKTAVGDGGGSSTTFNGRTAFNRGSK
jgi:hypothetical protein